LRIARLPGGLNRRNPLVSPSTRAFKAIECLEPDESSTLGNPGRPKG
jgi:hypothetical protein